MSPHAPLDRRGLSAAIAAYLMWGLFPLYWAHLKSVPALQIVAHRIVWCALFVVGWLLLSQGRGWLRQALAAPRVGRMLLASSLLISVNWGIYIWAVTHGQVVEASLGYFINPLIAVLLGVLVLGERLNRNQWIAVGIAALGVLWLAMAAARPPWIALSLALSFGVYGMIRKLAAVDAVPGLAIESLLLLLPALAWLAWAASQGEGSFAVGHWQVDVLLVIGGALTALPLIGFAYGARRIPYTLVGLLQYLSPTLQLLGGVLLLGESFGQVRAIGFGLIWLALLLYASDAWHRAARPQAAPIDAPHCDEHVPACDGATPNLEPLSESEAARADGEDTSSKPSMVQAARGSGA